MKQRTITAALWLTLGALFIVTLNSLGNVIKVSIVSPEEGYTAIQREQLDLLMKGVK